MSILDKYLDDPRSVAVTPVSEVLEDAAELEGDRLTLTVIGDDDRVLGAVVMLPPSKAQRYLAALDRVDCELE